MSQNNLELSVWGEDKVKLAFWDSENGNDRIFSLAADGTAFEDVIEGDREIKQGVDLVQELRKMALQFNEQARKEIQETMAKSHYNNGFAADVKARR